MTAGANVLYLLSVTFGTIADIAQKIMAGSSVARYSIFFESAPAMYWKKHIV